MARKRSRDFIDIGSTQESDGDEIEDISDSVPDSESNGFSRL